MNTPTALIHRRLAWPVRAALVLLAVLAVLAGSGCALLRAPAAADQALMAPELRACTDWYGALDAQTELAGVRDAGASIIAGFAHLRVDRFTASLRDVLDNDTTDAHSNSRLAALVQRLLQLDLQARAFEIANLPSHVRAGLAGDAIGPGVADLLQHTRDCGARLAAFDLTTPSRTADLLKRLVVPDDYATGYRIFGLYALSRVPFGIGVKRFEADRRAAFARDPINAVGSTRLRLSPPARPPSGTVATPGPDALPAAPALDPLGVPTPTPAQLEYLFEQHAPGFDIEVASDDDRPGALVWRPGPSPAAVDEVQVDSSTPVLYRQVAHTRYGADSLLQLVYTLWFAARTAKSGKALDLLAGKIDGLVFRVTLAPDGTPLVYDSIHPCGCYHMFFPTPAARPRPAPQAGIEWAFSPQTLAPVGAQDRLVLRIAAGTHYIERISVAPVDGDTPYAWRDYDELRSLPTSSMERRSVFGPDGFVAGTDRAESWLFWPMGIARAGAMRQWGHHATAFVGRRHFDDADLMEKRFEFDPVLFGR